MANRATAAVAPCENAVRRPLTVSFNREDFPCGSNLEAYVTIISKSVPAQAFIAFAGDAGAHTYGRLHELGTPRRTHDAFESWCNVVAHATTSRVHSFAARFTGGKIEVL